jgi:hypothetical protein
LKNYQANDKTCDLLLSMQNNGMRNSMITYNNDNGLRFHIDLDNVSQLEIRITDDLGRLIDFNGENNIWFLTLRLDIYYYHLRRTTNLTEIIQTNNKYLREKLIEQYLNEQIDDMDE